MVYQIGKSHHFTLLPNSAKLVGKLFFICFDNGWVVGTLFFKFNIMKKLIISCLTILSFAYVSFADVSDTEWKIKTKNGKVIEIVNDGCGSAMIITEVTTGTTTVVGTPCYN